MIPAFLHGRFAAPLNSLNRHNLADIRRTGGFLSSFHSMDGFNRGALSFTVRTQIIDRMSAMIDLTGL